MAEPVNTPRHWLEAGSIAVFVLLMRAPAMLSTRWYDPDEAAITMQATAMRRGGTLYIDMADRKPPLPPLLYEWSFRLTNSTDLRPLRLLVTVMLAAAAVLLVNDVRRTHGRVTSLWAGGLYVLGAFAFSPADAGAANYAHFALPIATVALICCRRPGVRWAAVGGLALGLAILARQSWIFAVPAGAFSVYRLSRWKGVLAFAGACAAGFLVSATFVPLSAFWYWAFASTPGFVFASTSIGAVVLRALGATGLFVLCHLTLTVAAGWGWPKSRRTDADLWVWVATGLVAIAAGFRFYGHYWMQVLPPLALLAAPVLASLRVNWQRLGAATIAATAVIMWILLLSPNIFRHRYSANAEAAYVRAHTIPDQRIFVWGSFPELSVQSDRPAAGRLVTSDFVTGRSGGRQDPADTLPNASARAQKTMMDDLRADPPELVVDTSGEKSLGYSRYPISVFPAFDDFVHANYTVETTLDGGFTIYRLSTP
jgi:hypothetical protein